MVLLVFVHTVVATEVDFAAFELQGLGLVYRLARHRTDLVDCDRFALFLRHLGYEHFGILVELSKTAFAARINILAFVLRAIFLRDRPTADRTEFVGHVLLLGAVRVSAGRYRARKYSNQKNRNRELSHNLNSTPYVPVDWAKATVDYSYCASIVQSDHCIGKYGRLSAADLFLRKLISPEGRGNRQENRPATAVCFSRSMQINLKNSVLKLRVIDYRYYVALIQLGCGDGFVVVRVIREQA